MPHFWKTSNQNAAFLKIQHSYLWRLLEFEPWSKYSSFKKCDWRQGRPWRSLKLTTDPTILMTKFTLTFIEDILYKELLERWTIISSPGEKIIKSQKCLLIRWLRSIIGLIRCAIETIQYSTYPSWSTIMDTLWIRLFVQTLFPASEQVPNPALRIYLTKSIYSNKNQSFSFRPLEKKKRNFE